MIAFALMRFYEAKGRLPLMKAKAREASDNSERSGSESNGSDAVNETDVEKKDGGETARPSTNVRELRA